MTLWDVSFLSHRIILWNACINQVGIILRSCSVHIIEVLPLLVLKLNFSFRLVFHLNKILKRVVHKLRPLFLSHKLWISRRKYPTWRLIVLYSFDRRIFSLGLSNQGCISCGRINDWFTFSDKALPSTSFSLAPLQIFLLRSFLLFLSWLALLRFLRLHFPFFWLYDLLDLFSTLEELKALPF